MSGYRKVKIPGLSTLVTGLLLAGMAAGAAADYRMFYKVNGVAPPKPVVTFTSHTFTNCGAAGPMGPAQNACLAAYADAGNSVIGADVFSVNGGIQHWKVPITGTYRIEAAGAGFNAYSYQRGAIMAGDFALQQGQELKLLVGQMATGHAAGSGGSFVATLTNTPLLVAGGSGGSNTNDVVIRGTTARLAEPGTQAANRAEGQGGACNGCNGRGGGGFYGDGQSSEGGKAFINGGHGGHLGQPHEGGFGGGGSRNGTSVSRAGGGGGYSGGNGSSLQTAKATGGGSYNVGANQNNRAGANTGHGYITISLIK